MLLVGRGGLRRSMCGRKSKVLTWRAEDSLVEVWGR